MPVAASYGYACLYSSSSKRMAKRIGKRNQEGYLDLTPYEALKDEKDSQDEVDAKRMDEALKSAKRTFSLYGFEVVGRITLRNIRTGKIYK